MYVCSNKVCGYRRRCMFVPINYEEKMYVVYYSQVQLSRLLNIKMGPISRPPIHSVQKQLVALYLCFAISVHLYILSIPTIEVSPI